MYWFLKFDMYYNYILLLYRLSNIIYYDHIYITSENIKYITVKLDAYYTLLLNYLYI